MEHIINGNSFSLPNLELQACVGISICVLDEISQDQTLNLSWPAATPSTYEMMQYSYEDWRQVLSQKLERYQR